MGRFYQIQAGSLNYTSVGSDGLDNPGALNVELDINVTEHDTPAGSAWVRIWGVGLDVLSQANQLLNQPFSMSTGMSAGLPFCHPEQQGKICEGLVSQAFGNWVGVDQTLDLVITAGSTPNTNPGPNPAPIPMNMVFSVKKGGDIAQAMQQTLQTGMPQYSVGGSMPAGYTAKEDMLSYYTSLEEFAFDMRRLTQRLKNDPAAIGIGIAIYNKAFSLSDGSSPTAAGTVNYEDLIGQPTWIGPNTLQTKLVMRGDLQVQKTLTLPKTLVTNTAAAAPSFNSSSSSANSLTFQGSSTIDTMRFVGNFRQADAASWVTIVNSHTSGS
jgi:hypothetical protein